MKNRTRNIAIGTAVAGVMGYVAGILTAPKSGRETREYLNKVRNSSVVEAEKELKKLHTELNNLIGEADKSSWTGRKKDAADDAVEGEVISTATRTRQKVRDILSAVHDGSADDDDLDKAILEASKAIKSIKAFLKK